MNAPQVPKTSAEMWEFLVTDQLKDEAANTVNHFIYIMRGELLAALADLGADLEAPRIYYQKGHQMLDDVIQIVRRMADYAFKKSRDPVPASYHTVAEDIPLPRVDNENEIHSLLVAAVMYRNGISPVSQIEAFLNAQAIVAMYGTPGITKAVLDYFNKMTEIWKHTLTGRRVIMPDSDVAELQEIVARIQRGE